MRWTLAVTGMALTFAALTGCQRPLFLTEPDYQHYRNMGERALECDPSAAIVPATTDLAPPTTIFDTDRKLRYVTLAEAIASTLEKGTTGVQSPFFPGPSPTCWEPSGRTLVGSDSIRVLAFQPSIVANDIEAALSKFDARWLTNTSWQTSDQPVGTALQPSRPTPVVDSSRPSISKT